MTKILSIELAAPAMLLLATTASAGPDHLEGAFGDAGSLPTTAQVVGRATSDPVNKIVGETTGRADFEDMYLIKIVNPAVFCASTSGSSCTALATGTASFDTQLMAV